MPFAMDDASVMTGKNKGVAAFITRDNPHAFIAGCSCHLIHPTASKGGARLQEDMAVTIEDAIVVKIYLYIDKSSERKEQLESFQIDAGMKSYKIIKLAQTTCFHWRIANLCNKMQLQVDLAPPTKNH